MEMALESAKSADARSQMAEGKIARGKKIRAIVKRVQG
jgi:hypothetical protein